MSGGKLFQTFMTRSVKKTDLVVLLQWCLNKILLSPPGNDIVFEADLYFAGVYFFYLRDLRALLADRREILHGDQL